MKRILLSISLLLGAAVFANSQINSTYFGQHMEYLGGYVAPPATPFPSASEGGQFGTFRFWDTAYWASVEPSNGRYSWTVLSELEANLKSNGVSNMIFTFGHVPAWASTKPNGSCTPATAGSCYPPTDSAWTSFVTQVVKQNCGVITYYELWNEANLTIFYNGTPSELVHLASLAYPIIHSTANCSVGGTNPNEVLMPSINDLSSGSISWLNKYLAAGGGKYADIGAFHGYSLSTTKPGYVLDSQLVSWVANYKAALAKYKLSLPIWNTEYSWGDTDDFPISTLGEPARQGFIAQTMLLFAASGVSRSIWYMYDACDWGTMYGPNCGTSPNSDTESGPRMTATAYGSIQTWMIGATLSGCKLSGNTWVCGLTRSSPVGYSAQAVWSQTGSGTYTVPSGAIQYRDLNGNLYTVSGTTVSITNLPILLENMSAF